jgi:hypothetical protein
MDMEEDMSKSLIGVSICVVVLLVLASLGNVVGYQTVKTSQQTLFKERINQKELLFQTILDTVNNKEIRRVILKSQMSRGIFPHSDIPVLTKNQLQLLYLVGMTLSKFISPSKMQSIIGKYYRNNQGVQKEIFTAVEKDVTLNADITELQNSKCDCENEKIIRLDLLTTICTILLVLLLPFALVSLIFASLAILFQQNPILIKIFTFFSIPFILIMLPIFLIGLFLNCWGN